MNLRHLQRLCMHNTHRSSRGYRHNRTVQGGMFAFTSSLDGCGTFLLTSAALHREDAKRMRKRQMSALRREQPQGKDDLISGCWNGVKLLEVEVRIIERALLFQRRNYSSRPPPPLSWSLSRTAQRNGPCSQAHRAAYKTHGPPARLRTIEQIPPPASFTKSTTTNFPSFQSHSHPLSSTATCLALACDPSTSNKRDSSEAPA
jgi:hypothetical protein